MCVFVCMDAWWVNAWAWLRGVVFTVLVWVVEHPFMTLYEQGPRAVGFWEGKPRADICSELTGASSDHWARNPDECNALIATRAHSWVLLIYAIIYCVLIWQVLRNPSILCQLFYPLLPKAGRKHRIPSHLRVSHKAWHQTHGNQSPHFTQELRISDDQGMRSLEGGATYKTGSTGKSPVFTKRNTRGVVHGVPKMAR